MSESKDKYAFFKRNAAPAAGLGAAPGAARPPSSSSAAAGPSAFGLAGAMPHQTQHAMQQPQQPYSSHSRAMYPPPSDGQSSESSFSSPELVDAAEAAAVTGHSPPRSAAAAAGMHMHVQQHTQQQMTPVVMQQSAPQGGFQQGGVSLAAFRPQGVSIPPRGPAGADLQQQQQPQQGAVAADSNDRSLRRRMASPTSSDPAALMGSFSAAAPSNSTGAGPAGPAGAALQPPKQSAHAVATPGGKNIVFNLEQQQQQAQQTRSDWHSVGQASSGSLISPPSAGGFSAAAVAPASNPFESSGTRVRGKRKHSDPDLTSAWNKDKGSKTAAFPSAAPRSRSLRNTLLAPVRMLLGCILPRNSKKDDDINAVNPMQHRFSTAPGAAGAAAMGKKDKKAMAGASTRKCLRGWSVMKLLGAVVGALLLSVSVIWYLHDCANDGETGGLEAEHLPHPSSLSVRSVSGEGGHLDPSINAPLNPASEPGGIVSEYLGNSLQEFEMKYPFLHPVLHFFKRPVDHAAHGHEASITQPSVPFTLVSLLRDMTPEFLEENRASYIFQYNALLSWVRLTPHVIVYMDSEVSCRSLTARPEFRSVQCFAVPCMHDTVHRPLLNCIFEHSHSHSVTEAMGFVNGDIILSPAVKPLVDKIGNEFQRYLVVSRRTDTQLADYLIDAYIDNYINRAKSDAYGTPFTPATAVDPEGNRVVVEDNVASATEQAHKVGTLHSEFGIDLFLYPKSTFKWMFPAFPPFLAGVYRWDNYFLTKMILHPEVSTIDASAFGLLIHQQVDGGKDHSKRSGAAINDALVKQHLGSVYKLGHINNVDYVLGGECPGACEITPNVKASVHVLYAKRATPTNWLAIIHVNANELIELNNFVCWANRHEFRSFLLLTRDREMYEEIMRRELPVIFLDRTLVDPTHSPAAGAKGELESAASVLQRYDFLFSVLKAGYHFFYTSVRTVFLDDPLRDLARANDDGTFNDVMARGNLTHMASVPYDGAIAVRSSTYGQFFWKQVHDCADMNKHIADRTQWTDCIPHNWKTLKGGLKKQPLDVMRFVNATEFFVDKTPLTHGFYPIAIHDDGVATNVDKYARLKSWGLMATKAATPVCLDDLPSFRARTFKPPTDTPAQDFRLKIRVLTFNRWASLQRLLDALQTANYDNDRVDLEISIDYPTNLTDTALLAEWTHTQLTARSFAWKHGKQSVIQQSAHVGLTGQWTQGWYPADDNKEVMLFLEDDTGVSPYFYIWVKRMVQTYYLNPDNYDPKLYGFALQTQHTILGETHKARYGTRKVPDLLNATAMERGDPNASRYFRYQLVGTWGGVFFPQHWREFLIWLRDRQFVHAEGVSPIFEPCVPTLVSNAWWKAKPHKVWSQWFVRFAFEKGWYNLYTNYPNQLSLVGNFREGGENFAVSKGLMNEMVDEINSPPGSDLYNHLHFEPLPTPVSSIPLYDFHFNEVRNPDVLAHRLAVWGNKDNVDQCITIAEMTKKKKEAEAKLKAKMEAKKKEAERKAKEALEGDTSILANFAALENTMAKLKQKGVVPPTPVGLPTVPPPVDDTPLATPTAKPAAAAAAADGAAKPAAAKKPAAAAKAAADKKKKDAAAAKKKKDAAAAAKKKAEAAKKAEEVAEAPAAEATEAPAAEATEATETTESAE